MKACLVENGKMVWTEVAEPAMNENEVLVEIYAAALNRADLLQKQGTYPSPVGWPAWPGLELSGVIVDMGEKAKANSKFKVGDKVCALLGGGGYAEEVVVPEGMCMPLPRGYATWEAAGIPEVYATAYLNLKIEGRLAEGETFFINGGEGTTGLRILERFAGRDDIELIPIDSELRKDPAEIKKKINTK